MNSHSNSKHSIQLNNEQKSWWRQTALPTVSLFTSLSTLVCCALPALLVSIGLGASLSGLINAAPWITVISQYKIPLFIVSAVILIAASIMQINAKQLACPIDPLKAKACARLRLISWWILGIAILTYAIGFFFAFLAIYVL